MSRKRIYVENGYNLQSLRPDVAISSKQIDYAELLHYPQIMEDIQSYIDKNKERFLKELGDFLRIQSVSADPTYASSVATAADHLKNLFLSAGADQAEVISTAGNPVVFAEKKSSDANAPVILVYGHYDVQPAGDPALWDTPAFEPTVRDGRIYARGAADDKAQVFLHVKVLEFLSQITTALPCSIQFIIEGEEEISSPHLGEAVEKLRNRITAQAGLVSDTDMIGKDVPSLVVGLRGIAYFEITAVSAARDLHSGVYGGAVANPFHALAKILGAVTDPTGKISIPGFYDAVLPSREEDKKTAEVLVPKQDAMLSTLGVAEYVFEEGYSPYESSTCRPSFDIHGMPGGYVGAGSKTIIPASASAKISFRLVPDQDPEQISSLFEHWVESVKTRGASITIKRLGGGHPSLLTTESPEYRAAERAIQEVYGKMPLAVRSGGSIPVAALFEKTLGIPTVLLGFSLEEDSIHAPNESFDLEQFFSGIRTVLAFYLQYRDIER